MLLIAAIAMTLSSAATTLRAQPSHGMGQQAHDMGKQAQVRSGADILIADSLQLLRGKRIGLLCNHTSRLADGRLLFDVLSAAADVELAAVFTPEHGFTGSADAGAFVGSGKEGGLPVYSLYGNTRRPSREMLAGLDLLVMDLQDVGARYYTYVTTMMYCLEEAARSDLPVLLLDRPNPLGGEQVEGPVREAARQSFVAYLPVPVRHGMTAGELARMAIGEGWLRTTRPPRLTVLSMQGWRRNLWYDETGLPWVRPSPNIVSVDAALAYVGTCLLEGSNLSEGRGTDTPFLLIGAPFVDGREAAAELNAQGLPGVRFHEVEFEPVSRPGAAKPRFQGQRCGGVRLEITSRTQLQAWLTGVTILRVMSRLCRGKMTMTSYLSVLAGTDLTLSSTQAIPTGAWQAGVDAFVRARSPYLLYR